MRALEARQHDAETGVELELKNANRVFGFICDDLGMQPLGSLCHVDSMPKAKGSGITYPTKRTSYVVRDAIEQDFPPEFAKFTETLNEFRREAVAVHELTHLADSQDTLYLSLVNLVGSVSLGEIYYPGTSLEDWPDVNKGSYIEEGLGVLTGNLYVWHHMPHSANMKETSPYQSPGGTTIHMPVRSNVLGHHIYTFCGWGFERLVDMAPDVWDIALSSRRYHCDTRSIRGALKACIDNAQRGLFDVLDATDPDDIDQVIEATARIDHAATRRGY